MGQLNRITDKSYFSWEGCRHMIIRDKKYAIVSKEFPLEFYDGIGGETRNNDV